MRNLLRKIPRKNRVFWLIILVVLTVAGIFFIRRFDLKKNQREALENIASVPSESVKTIGKELPTLEAQDSPIKTPIPEELNLKVPFTSQAPTANWDRQHEENCEEASLLMASRYFNNREITGSEDAEEAMAQIVTWENENLGVSDSIDAEQTARTMREFLNLKTEIVQNPTTEEIKQAIADNKLVLVPAAGRELGNPFYKSPGPLYHMIVIKGYTESQFITNDPGTRNGENYVYDFDVVLNANRDWNSGDVANGARKMIFVSS